VIHGVTHSTRTTVLFSYRSKNKLYYICTGDFWRAVNFGMDHRESLTLKAFGNGNNLQSGTEEKRSLKKR